ncbi:metal ABC transporter solute-binding protein, Zn/Mn family [Vogesella indigofera]|uniref:metal ABC transporter solute-binding protein, Zn/Mn family n=1 Tax=Vogesella indigofera TaxID=45465 RepID=UPI00234F6E80|nr:zinc ABC transporter substrate-binding protein [Vogesella indigofera]MDC7701507.1 zinc ABC transporter substrate-binding protein [Vogesella indigofera]
MNVRKIIVSSLLLSPLAAWANLPVVASFSIMADITREVGGERVSVVSLVGADQDAHVFQPKPADVKKLAEAKVFVVNGLGFEGWINRLNKSANFKGVTVTAANGLKPLAVAEDGHGHDEHGHDHGRADPHAWHNPQHVLRYVDNIAAGLSRADAAGAAYYRERAAAYKARLQELDSWAGKQFAAVPAARRKVLTSHDAFAYLGQRYAIRFMAPQGVSTDAEASAKSVAQLIRQVKKEQVKAVFIENMSDRRLIDQLAKEAGVKVGGKLYSDALSSQPGARSYLEMFRSNVTALSQSM